MNRFHLLPDKTALLVIDIQEKLAAAMNPGAYAQMLKRAEAAVVGARALGLPVIVTEQYSKGLGPTVGRISAALPEGTQTVEKLRFSCAGEDVLNQLQGKKQVLLVGMETHVCVFQTARDLVEKGFNPHVLCDGVLSRSEDDKRIGLELCQGAGAVLSTVETALFDLLQVAGSPQFKQVSAAVKDR